MRALQAILPVPFLAIGSILFLAEPVASDVVVRATYHHETTTTHVDSTTTSEGSTTVPDTSTIPETTTTIDQCPPELEPCTPGQQTTIPDSTTTTEIINTSIPNTTTTIDQCPPEDEPCTPGQQTTIPTTTSTIPDTTTTSSTSTSTLPGTTTTLPPVETTTTVALNESFDIGAASSVCSRDVPFIDLSFGNEPQFNGLVGTITFTTLDGDFIEEIPLVYQANTTVRVVFPGASFDPVTGEATDWPGWRLNSDGFWVTDPTDAEFRDGIVVTAFLPAPVGGLGESFLPQQVSASTTVTYPPETAACNSPSGPFGPTTPQGSTGGTLPATGMQAVGLLILTIGIAIGLGNVFVQFGRKPRDTNS